MIGTAGATIVIVAGLIEIGFAGLVAGGLTRLARRRPWGLKNSLIDAVLAAVLALVVEIIGTEVLVARGYYWYKLPLVALIVAVVCVVLRNLLPARASGHEPSTG